MARLLVKDPDFSPAEIQLAPGCNRLGREGDDNDFLIPHASVSRHHCEVWLTDDAVLVRDLGSRNGTFIEGQGIEEGQITAGQTLRIGDVEMTLAEAPVRISVPDLPMPPPPRPPTCMPDGSPCCLRHDGVPAAVQCGKCAHVFCGECVRELRVAGGTPRRFCPDCGGTCEKLVAATKEARRSGLLGWLVDAFTKPTPRK